MIASRTKVFYSIITCVLLTLVLSCKTHVHSNEVTIEEMETPPNGIKISPNLYIDKTEVTNYSYAEFIEWYRHIYGMDSEEYKQLLPNVVGWAELGKTYYPFSDYYFQHPAYRDYPVVNITYDQAKAFCKWRADRVMEFILIREGIIKHIPNPHKDSVFTIERYFTEKYRGITPNKGLMVYPEYSLPDTAIYIMALTMSDSLSFVNQKRFKKLEASNQDWVPMRCYESISFKNDTLPYGPDPTVRIYNPGIKWNRFNKTNTITHVLGNVTEMTNREGITFGGSYKDSCAAISRNHYLQKQIGSNCYTGFRCVCRYKKWENK